MKWEYLSGAISDFVDGNSDYVFVSAIINDDNRISLNELGEKGWELVAIVQNIAYFKRPINETQKLIDQAKRAIAGIKLYEAGKNA